MVDANARAVRRAGAGSGGGPTAERTTAHNAVEVVERAIVEVAADWA